MILVSSILNDDIVIQVIGWIIAGLVLTLGTVLVLIVKTYIKNRVDQSRGVQAKIDQMIFAQNDSKTEAAKAHAEIGGKIEVCSSAISEVKEDVKYVRSKQQKMGREVTQNTTNIKTIMENGSK